jgi:sporulation protein YlmC with PRC-barrel domain
MKRNIIIACALAIGTSMGLAADPLSTSGQSPASATSGQYQPQQMQLFDSSIVANTKITDKSGKHLGKVERLLIDSQSGRVRFVVVQVDKEWSLNDPEVIIPWGSLMIAPQGDKAYTVQIDATRDKLLNAPHFDKALVQQLTTRESGQPIYSYWGVTWQDDSSSGTARAGSTSSPLDTSSSTNSPTSSSSPSAAPTSPSSTATTSEPATTPTTTTDGSVGNQSIGNSGTSDSPKPESKLGQPAPGGTSNLKSGSETPSESSEPDRTLGGDESD